MAPEFKMQTSHFVHLLDSSGSMLELSWKQLINCVSTFFKELESNALIKELSKVFVIRYCFIFEVVFVKERPRETLVSGIFHLWSIIALPLKDAYKIC